MSSHYETIIFKSNRSKRADREEPIRIVGGLSHIRNLCLGHFTDCTNLDGTAIF